MSIVFYSCVVTSHDISRGNISLDRSDHHGCSVSHITSVIMDVSVTHIAAVIMHLGFAVKTPSNLRGGCPCRTVASDDRITASPHGYRRAAAGSC